MEGDHREHAPAGVAEATGDLGKAKIRAERKHESHAQRQAQRERKLHDVAPAATSGTALDAVRCARNALKRRATSAGAIVGRPSLLIEPAAMRASMSAGLGPAATRR